MVHMSGFQFLVSGFSGGVESADGGRRTWSDSKWRRSPFARLALSEPERFLDSLRSFGMTGELNGPPPLHPQPTPFFDILILPLDIWLPLLIISGMYHPCGNAIQGEDTMSKPGAVCATRNGLVLVNLHAPALARFVRQNHNT